MSCRERRERIYLHAAGVLEDDERTELEAHLGSGCPECNEALDEERERLGALALALAPVVPPARVRERLLERVREQTQRGTHPSSWPAPRAWRPALGARRAAGFAAVGLGAAALTLAAVWWQGERPAAEAPASAAPAGEAGAAAELELASLRDELAEQDETLAELESEAEAALQVSKLLGARELEVLDLAAAEPGSEAWGRAFWDPEYRCYFRAEGLAPLAPEQSYVLWMIGAEERVHAAGVLAPDARGDVTFYTRLPRELSPISRTFVTAETSPHGELPAGPTLLAGAARP
jgi:anti-sigma-K factor RskA